MIKTSFPSFVRGNFLIEIKVIQFFLGNKYGKSYSVATIGNKTGQVNK